MSCYVGTTAQELRKNIGGKAVGRGHFAMTRYRGRPTLESLFSDHGDFVRRFIASRIENAADVSDLVQDTFLRIIRHGRLDAIDNQRAYVSTVARNLMRDYFRRLRNGPQPSPIDADALVAIRADPEQELSDRQILSNTLVAIESLTEPQRTAFVLSRFGDLTYPQIAERMGCSTKTIEKYMAQALKQLRLSVGRHSAGASPARDQSDPGSKDGEI